MIRSAMQTALAAGVAALFAGPAVAEPEASAPASEPWGEWRALSEGFVGRRREPPGLERAVEHRRLPEVEIQARLLDRPGAPGLARAAEARALAQSAAAALSAGAAVRTNAQSAWLKTGEPGLYGVSLDALALEAGMNASQLRNRARSGRLNVLNDGRPVSWHYDRGSDRLLFAALAYETFYAEGNAYQVVPAQTPDPQRMTETRPASGRGRGDTALIGQPTPFRESLRFEEEPDMFFNQAVAAGEPDADFWFWDYLWGGFKDSIEVTLNLPSTAAEGVGELRVELRGWTRLNPGNEHQVYAELNGVQVGPVIAWDGFETAELVAQFDQGLLNPDGDNTLRLRNIYAAGTNPGQFLDAVEVDYLRLPVVSDGQLWMRGVAGGTQAVTGLASPDVLVIESPVRGARLRGDAQVYADGTGWAVAFSANPGADFLVVESSALSAPAIDGPATDDLRSRQNAAEYLIIAPRELAGTAEALAEYRRAHFGAVKIAWLDDIYKAFGAGRVDPFAIGRFMRTAMNEWGQAPSMVLLVGKGSLDHKDRMGYGDSFVPVVMTSNPWSLAPSDARLLGFDDGITPFAYGRLPIMNDDEGLAYVDKLAGHELRLRTGERGAVVAADNPDDAGDFHAHSVEMTQRLSELGFDFARQLFHPRDQVRTALIDSVTWDQATYLSYDGHGSVQQIGNYRERFLLVADAQALRNEHLPVFTALTCAAGDDSLPATRSLAAALVLNPEGGAIASLAPTGLSLGPDAHVLGLAFVDELFGWSQPVGAAVSAAKQAVDGQISGFMSPMYGVLGDPAVRAE
ncbi:MAG: C25 family cysteine peptidase [Chromatiaceae bacterium]|nr:C25 family cysteine peptidase [Chromatiaceae bacterium]